MATLVLIEGKAPDGWYVARKIVNDRYIEDGHYYQFYNLNGQWAGSGACFKEKSQANCVRDALVDEHPIPSGTYEIAGEYSTQWISIENITEKTFVGTLYDPALDCGSKAVYDSEEMKYWYFSQMLDEVDACEGDIIEVTVKRRV